MPAAETLYNIARQAKRDLNTYQAKTGAHKISPTDEAGVDTRVEQKFPGADVKYDSELSTNAGYNRRIPPTEGGDLDAHSRQTRGQHFEGVGGIEHKEQQRAQDFGGSNDDEIRRLGNPLQKPKKYDGTKSTVPHSQEGDMLPRGQEAVHSNLKRSTHNPRKGQFKGSDYYTPESVPDSISAEGNVPPGIVTQSSRESDGY